VVKRGGEDSKENVEGRFKLQSYDSLLGAGLF
jgi:hypothetical protein